MAMSARAPAADEVAVEAETRLVHAAEAAGTGEEVGAAAGPEGSEGAAAEGPEAEARPEVAGRPARMTWTEETRRALWNYVRSRKGKASVARVLREFCATRGVSFHTARAKYYEMLRERGSEAAGGPGRNWSQAEDDRLLGIVRDTGAGTLGDSFERAARALERTVGAVRARYYRLQETGSAPRPETGEVRSGAPAAVGEPEQADLLNRLAAFLDEGRRVPGLDLGGLVAGLARLSQLARLGAQAGDLEGRLQTQAAENERLRKELETLRSQMEAVREQHRTLAFLVDDFINLNSIDKVTSLGDFGRRLKYQVDQFGLVVRVQRA